MRLLQLALLATVALEHRLQQRVALQLLLGARLVTLGVLLSRLQVFLLDFLEVFHLAAGRFGLRLGLVRIGSPGVLGAHADPI